MKKLFLNILAIVLILIPMNTVGASPQLAGAENQQALNESAGHPASDNPAVKMAKSFSGKVVETIQTPDYTYVLVDTGEKKVWAATPSFNGNPGDMVTVPPGLPMANFKSKTLKREFEMVYFVGAIGPEGVHTVNEHKTQDPGGDPPVGTNGAMPDGHPAVGMQGGMPGDHPPMGMQAGMAETHPPMGGMSDADSVDVGTVKKAEGGKTVAEIITGRKNLAGQKVLVRAKVVKFSPDILEKNWLHVQDGSGSEGANDLIVTTGSTVKVGDVVVISGIVAVDRDFGFGLKYPVLIENAEITVE